MNGERAVLFATDPPYLVDYSGADHPNQGNVDWSSLYKDGRGEEDALYDGYVSMAVEHALDVQAAWYYWHASRRQAMLKDEGYSVAFVEVAKWVHQDQSCPV